MITNLVVGCVIGVHLVQEATNAAVDGGDLQDDQVTNSQDNDKVRDTNSQYDDKVRDTNSQDNDKVSLT